MKYSFSYEIKFYLCKYCFFLVYIVVCDEDNRMGDLKCCFRILEIFFFLDDLFVILVNIFI